MYFYACLRKLRSTEANSAVALTYLHTRYSCISKKTAVNRSQLSSRPYVPSHTIRCEGQTKIIPPCVGRSVGQSQHCKIYLHMYIYIYICICTQKLRSAEANSALAHTYVHAHTIS